MIKSKKDLNFYLQEDAIRAGMPTRYTISGYIQYIIKLAIGDEQAHVLKYLHTLRHLEYWTNTSTNIIHELVRKYWNVRHSRMGHRYGIHIGANMVGYGIKIAHFSGGVIINCRKMGNYCTVSTGVVIGNKDIPEARPTIEDHVELAMGSKIYGDIHIGKNVRIAPNTVVYKNISDNVAVGGNPAKIIKTYPIAQ